MVQAKDVEKLNARIEELNTERTKAETKQEVLLTKLNEEIVSYKNSYGVDLEGKSFKEIKKKVNAEVKSVTEKVEEEYKLKLQVIQAINNGDYNGAKALLGESVEESAEDEVEEVVNAEEAEETVEEEETIVAAESPKIVTKPLTVDDDIEDDFDMDFLDDNDDVDPDAEDSVLKDEPVDEVSDSDDEDEEDEISMPSNFLKAVSKASKTEITGKSVKDTVSALDSASLVVEDDDDDEDDDFGFGEMLNGTKFEN